MSSARLRYLYTDAKFGHASCLSYVIISITYEIGYVKLLEEAISCTFLRADKAQDYYSVKGCSIIFWAILSQYDPFKFILPLASPK